MVGQQAFRVFISAVTPELKSYREEVARVLRRKGLYVQDQSHFRQGGATLLDQLRAYIENCDATILLVGEQAGSFPTAQHQAALGDVDGFADYVAQTGQETAAYTQWEWFLAKAVGRKTYVFMTAPGFEPDGPGTDDDDEARASQVAYRTWIENSGEHRDPLTTLEKLIEDVLVLPFPDLSKGKPNTLPYASLGDLFKGRDTFLADLTSRLQAPGEGHAAAIVGAAKAVHGLGGVGKTRAAIEYAWVNADSYAGLLYLRANTAGDLNGNLAALTAPGVLDLPQHTAAEDEIKVAAALDWLAGHPGLLIIFDNVDTEDGAAAVEALLPRLSDSHVLITSRLSNWGGAIETFAMDVLQPEDATDFLLARADRRRAADDDQERAAAIAESVGHLALALEQAAAYINTRRLAFAQYQEDWQSARGRVLNWIDQRQMTYELSVAVTWQTSVDQLGPAARDLLDRLAWLAPDAIPEMLLDVAVPDVEVEDGDRRDPHAALAELEGFSLVSRSAEAQFFSVHNLVQDVTRRRLSSDGADTAMRAALAWINAAFAGDPQDVRTWATLDPLVLHALAVTAHAEERNIGEPPARLISQVGLLYDAKARFAEAEPLMRRALQIDEVSYGKDHPNVAVRLSNLASLLRATNRLAESEPLMRRALRINEASYGQEHPTVAIRLVNLASLLQATNRLEEAEPLIRRALHIDEVSYGKDHPDVATDLVNLASLLQATNRFDEAEPLKRRALQIDEASYGKDHPTVATALNNLAQLLQATNRLDEAEPLMRRVVKIFEKSYGKAHPNVATAVNNLASLLQATNRLAQAEPMKRRALQIDEASYGKDHPKVAIRLNNLALLLHATNRLGEAEPLMRRALEIWTSSLGSDHPDTRAAQANLDAMEAQLRSQVSATNPSTDANTKRGRLARLFGMK